MKEARFLAGQGRLYTHKDKKLDYPTISLSEIESMLQAPQQGVPKGEGWWFCPTTYIGPDARGMTVQRQLGTAHALVADIDVGDPTLPQVIAATRKVIGNPFKFLVYTSPSSGEVRGDGTVKRKWRVVIPLAEPLPGSDYAAHQKALRLGYEQNGIQCDRSLDTLSQPVYLPNRGPHYEYHVQPGDPLVLQLEDGPHPIAQWAGEYLADEQQVRDEPGTEGSRSPLAAFRRKHSIEDMLRLYGFQEAPNDPDRWRHPDQSTPGYGSVRIMRYGDSDRWVSRSDTVNSMGVGRLTSNGSRMGDAFDLYVHFNCNGDRKQAEAYARQCLKDEDKLVLGEATSEHGKWLWENYQAGIHAEAIKGLQQIVHDKLAPDEGNNSDWTIEWPPGMGGVMAEYSYRASTYPVKQFSIAAALIFLTMVARNYSVHGHGLNLYALMVGGTGRGKGVARAGTKRLLARTMQVMEDDYLYKLFGHQLPASDAGLYKLFAVDARAKDPTPPPMTAILYQPDAGGSLMGMARAQRGSNDDKLLMALLQLWDSGQDDFLGGRRQSKVEDSTQTIFNPSLSLLMDIQPDSFNEFLSVSRVIESGLGPRLLVFPYYGPRGNMNYEANDVEPPTQLLEWVVAVTHHCRANHGVQEVYVPPETLLLMREVEAEVTASINEGGEGVEMFNRAAVNINKVAGLLAVGVNYLNPVLTPEVYLWAKRLVQRGIQEQTKLMRSGLASGLDKARIAWVEKLIAEYPKLSPGKRGTYRVPKSLRGVDYVFPTSYFIERLTNNAAFQGGAGSTDNIQRTLKNMVQTDRLQLVMDKNLIPLPHGKVISNSLKQDLYMVTSEFEGD